MQAIFEIKKCFPNVHKPRPHGEIRKFFIAAEEEVWDYAPTPTNDGFVSTHGMCAVLTDHIPTTEWFLTRTCVCREADVFLTRGKDRIGSCYKKVRYVEYTDNTFMTKMLRTPEEQHLGILGNTGYTVDSSTDSQNSFYYLYNLQLFWQNVSVHH